MCERKETEFLQDTTDWLVTDLSLKGAISEDIAADHFNGRKLQDSIEGALRAGYPDMTELHIQRYAVSIAIQVCNELYMSSTTKATLYSSQDIIDLVARALFAFDRFYAAKEYILKYCCER